MEALVSVIVPVYNAQAYLDRCVSSLTQQTYPQLEIILVDDGSTDHSPAICDGWAEKDPRVRVVHQSNTGAGLARNTGLDLATGRYVLFMDSDDYMALSAVEKCVGEMEKHPADVVMFGRVDTDADGSGRPKPMRDDRLYFSGDAVTGDLLPGLFTYDRGIGTSVWGKLFDLQVIRGSGVRFHSERELLSEDAYFILELFAHIRSVTVLPEPLYYYCKNGDSLSHTYREGHQERNNTFCRKSLDLCRALGYPPAVAAHVQARYHMYAISGMKRIVSAPLDPRRKHRAFGAVFRDPLLRSTLTGDVLKLDRLPSRLFWKLFALGSYHLCYLLIWWKARK